MRKHPVVQMLTIGVVGRRSSASAIGLNIHWFPASTADTAAHKIDTLYDVLLICSVPVFVLGADRRDLQRGEVPRSRAT